MDVRNYCVECDAPKPCFCEEEPDCVYTTESTGDFIQDYLLMEKECLEYVPKRRLKDTTKE